MARSDPYATAAEYRARRDKLDTDDDAIILAELTGVSRFIDLALGRFVGFGKDATAVARLYECGFDDRLYVDDYVSVTTVEEYDGTDWVATTDYEKRPLNAALDGWPYREVRRTSGTWAERVRLTAVFGWPAVPEAIKSACIELTAILRMETPRATSRMNEMKQVLTTSRPAQEIINNLIRVYTNPGAYV